MKRTYGKTKTRPKRRKINIVRDGWVVSSRWAPTLTQALRDYAKDRSMDGHSVVGNVMTHNGATYIAKEAR